MERESARSAKPPSCLIHFELPDKRASELATKERGITVVVLPVDYATPPPLRPGDTIAVVAPSSPFPRQELLVGMAWLQARYTIVASDKMSSRHGYLAGDDERRRAELTAAIARDDVKAIIAARGGYGATRILDVDWSPMVRAPKWLVGFSDITALHCEVAKVGVRSVHAPNVTGLARVDPWTRHCFLSALERPEESLEWNNLETLREGTGEGPAIGGNLALVESMAAAGRLVLPPGAVLFLEDVTERPYRIDRMLTALRLGGYLSAVSAVVFGSFSECEPGPDGVTVQDVLAGFARDAGVPVVCGAPFGHASRNDAFILGRTVKVGKGRANFV